MQPAHGHMVTRAGPQHAGIVRPSADHHCRACKAPKTDGEETVSAQVSLKSTLHNVSCDGRNRQLGACPSGTSYLV